MSDDPLPAYVDSNWHQYDLSAIWRQMEPEDDYFTRLQANAWNRTYDMLDAHRVTLEALFDGLAKIWPPLAGSASEAYLIKLRGLIESVTFTSHDASGNALAVSSIADGLMHARAQIQALHTQTMQPYDRRKLDDQAAKAMTESDKATYDYATLLRGPQRYKVSVPERDSSSGLEFDGSPESGGLPGSSRAHSLDSAHTSPSTEGLSSSDWWTAPPVLSGGPSPTSAAPPLGAMPGQKPAPKGADPGDRVWPRTPANVLGPYRPADLNPAGSLRGPRLSPEPTRSEGMKGAEEGRIPQGRQPRETGPSGERPGLLPPIGVGGSGSRSRRRPTGPAYTEWEVARGVPPVLKPPPEPTDFDPGPGVFGIDR